MMILKKTDIDPACACTLARGNRPAKQADCLIQEGNR
jgi:hypothetical protein